MEVTSPEWTTFLSLDPGMAHRGVALAALAAAVCLLAAAVGAQSSTAKPGERSWLEDVDCSHALMPGVEAGGR